MKRRNISPYPVKHVPQRTCVACRQVRSKREMVRLVAVPDGRVEIDTTGKKAGRGAYLCPARECLEMGFRGNRLEHSLRTTLTLESRERLIKEVVNLSAKTQY